MMRHEVYERATVQDLAYWVALGNIEDREQRAAKQRAEMINSAKQRSHR